MKIGVISDTHLADLSTGIDFLNALCAGPFAEVELILHAGDIVHPDLLYCFDARPVLAVRGNCDESSAELPERRIHTVGRYRIGLIHGWGAPSAVVANVTSSFAGSDIDVLVFGHSHLPVCHHNDDLLLFNPGSATDRREAPFHSVGVLTLGESVRGEIVNLDRISGCSFAGALS